MIKLSTLYRRVQNHKVAVSTRSQMVEKLFGHFILSRLEKFYIR